MAQYAMITETGLSEIDNAHPLGQYIEVAYYLPVYDYRIDNTILPTDDTVSATEIRTVTSSADTVPQGELLWNVSGDNYALSTDQTYLVRTGDEIIATSGSNKMITDFAHKELLTINKFKTSAISNYYTADSVISPGNSGTAWYFPTASYELLTAPSSAAGFGPEDHSNPSSQFLYKGVTYQHVITSVDDSRANFKVTMRANNGQIKFNKVGLYGVKRTADGVIVADPFLFAQVIIPEPQILYSKDLGSGKMSEITLDFQIETKTLSAGMFEDVFYSTSGDYWVRTTNESNGNYGLSYDGSVYVSNTLGIDETGAVIGGEDDRSVAKLLVGTFEYVNKPITSAEREMPQMCLQYVSSQGIESKRIRTTLKTNVSGDCEFDMYGACLIAHTEKYSLIPAYDADYGFGLPESRWSHAFLSDKFEMFDDSRTDVINAANFTGGYVNFNSLQQNAYFGNTNVYVGPYHNQAQIAPQDDGNSYLIKIENSNYTHGNISSYKASATDDDGTYTQDYDLLIRGLNDVAMITLSAESADKYTAEEIIRKMWRTLDTPTDTIVELEAKIMSYTAKLVNLDPNSGKYRALESSIRKFEAAIDDISESIVPHLNVDNDVMIFAGKNIYTYGNMVPMRNIDNDLGSYNNLYNNLYIKNIIGWNYGDSIEKKKITVQSNLVPNGSGFSIKGYDGHEWNEITAQQFGRSSNYVERGYIQTINTKKIELPEDGNIAFLNGVDIQQKKIIGSIDNIGTIDNPVRTIYVNDLKLINNYEDYIYNDPFIIHTNTTDDITYNDMYYKAGTGNTLILMSKVRARYDSLLQRGTVTMSLDVGEEIAFTRRKIYDMINTRIADIPYSLFLNRLGFNSIKFINVENTPVKFKQEGTLKFNEQRETEFEGSIFDNVNSVSTVGFSGIALYVDYSSVSKVHLIMGGRWLYTAKSMSLKFNFEGQLNNKWTKRSVAVPK